MDIKLAKEKKRELQLTILSLLEGFQSETGLFVKDIHLTRIDMSTAGEFKLSQLCAVHLEVEIE